MMPSLFRPFTRLIPVAAACLLLAESAAPAAQIERVDLFGRITSDGNVPVPGATVFVSTARPRDGIGALCPSCYPDCIKQARTGPTGDFHLEALDTSLIFQLLVAAPGYQPKYVKDVNPGDSVTASLEPARTGPSLKYVRGQVIDTNGRPIEGAAVSAVGRVIGSSTRFGGHHGTDELAVTDADGNFTLTSSESLDALGLAINMRGFAPRVVPPVKVDLERQVFTLAEGASVNGRILKGGQPLKDVVIGLTDTDRRAGSSVGHFEVGTDEQGRFLFVNIPPDREYLIYGTMKSLGTRGATPARKLRVGGDGEVTPAGELGLVPSHSLGGQIRLTDGKPLPAGIEVILGREGVWDYLQVKVDTDGFFAADGFPDGETTISTRVPGYRFSQRNGSLDPLNPFRLKGTLNADKTDLVLEFEPGNFQPPAFGSSFRTPPGPLRGAEQDSEPNDGSYRGAIKSSSGEGVAGVSVYQLADQNILIAGNGMVIQGGTAQRSQTDSQGRFLVRPAFGSHTLIAIGEQGFAEVEMKEFAKNPEAILSPWGRVEGRLFIGDQPGAGETVILTRAQIPYLNESRTPPPLFLRMQATTDAEGRFVFSRVPPGATKVAHLPRVQESARGLSPESQVRCFDLGPGEARRLKLGGEGRTVIGRIVVTGYDKRIDWRQDVQLIRLVLPLPGSSNESQQASDEYQARLSAASSEAARQAVEQWFLTTRAKDVALRREFYKTPEGREFAFREQRSFALNFAQDGTFRIEDVPGGAYRLEFNLREASEGLPQLRFQASQIARLHWLIEVPPTPEGELGATHDLGTLEVRYDGAAASGRR